MEEKPKSCGDTSRGLVRCLSRIPSWLAYAISLLALLGAILFVIGAAWSFLLLQASPSAVHPSTVLMIGGAACMAMLVPLTFIVHLAKEISSIRTDRNRGENGAHQPAGGADDVGPTGAGTPRQ